jgi:SAM-dependent methyltransferase
MVGGPARIVAYTGPRCDVARLAPGEARSILDLGCGNGALGAALRAARPGRRVVGVDHDGDFVAEAAARLDRVIQADLNVFDWDVGFGGETFDCIIFADVLEHLILPESVLASARRFLAPGGCIVVSLPNIRHLSALASIAFRGTFPRRDRGIFDRTHLRWFCLSDACRMITQSGYRVETITSVLRLRDRPGGRLNRLVGRTPAAIARLAPVREFLTYQFLIRAR